jgi:hypothetical protein
MNQESLKVLQELLARPIENEAQVVYFLVELRKLIENLEDRYRLLTFFCDWILHSKLDRKYAKEILDELDGFIEQVKVLGGHPNKGLMDRIVPLISLQRFHNDLFLLLGEHGLDTELVGDLRRWGPFFSLYIDIIAKTPLIADAGKLNLKHIDTIKVSKFTKSVGPPAASGEHFAFGIEWSLRKNDKEQLAVLNEVWFPEKPTRVQVTTLHLTTDGQGQLQPVPLESKSFWN